MFRHVFWFLALAVVAVAMALLVGNNPGSVALFWPPYRVDMSFNLVLFGVVLLFVLLHLGWRGASSLMEMPMRARRWRAAQLERAAVSAVLDALSHQLAGRFVRAQTAGNEALQHLMQMDPAAWPRHAHLQATVHLLLAESAHALQNRELRDHHLNEALRPAAARSQAHTREGALLRATRWAIEDRDASAAQHWLNELPQGAARRIQALRLRLRVARLTGDATAALELARVLAKHRAYSSAVAPSVLRGLALDALRQARDSAQLDAVWGQLDPSERAVPEVAMAAAEQLQRLLESPPSAAAGRDSGMASGAVAGPGSDADDAQSAITREAVQRARQWVLDCWPAYPQLSDALRVRFAKCMAWRMDPEDAGWLSQVEQMQRQWPNDPCLQFLAGQACLQRQLWGKAAQLLGQARNGLRDPGLLRQTWRGLAQLAEQRGDSEAAQSAWREAARID